ncbi:unnamed protein product [Eruca vesicaria subsp. sativa]|uniref:Uncharacterized protein n=1 Tax=Eruca vesicaria subsp. sativa TaxID=29727 RepID=A0ABC8L306_ERUVS|nr:unnamed protein product [Eruca vesicaria subsp. sativa]
MHDHSDNKKSTYTKSKSPLREESFFHFPTTTEKEDVADRVTSKNLFYGGWTVDQSLKIRRISPRAGTTVSGLQTDLRQGQEIAPREKPQQRSRFDHERIKTVQTARRRERGGVLNRGGDQPRFGDESSRDQPRKRWTVEPSNPSRKRKGRNTKLSLILTRGSKTRLFSPLN